MSTAVVQNPPEMLRRKSTESCPVRSDYEDIDSYLDQSSSIPPPSQFRDDNGNFTSDPKGLNHCNRTETLLQKDNVSRSKTEGPVELMCMFDLLNLYQGSRDDKSSDYKSVNECLNTPKYDEFPIYATVDKTMKIKARQNSDKKKVLKPIRVDPPQIPPPPVPPKPKTISQDFGKKPHQGMLAESVNSPEMQVMINSLSPVLIRRNSKNRRRNNPSAETSPECTPKVSSRVERTQHDMESNSGKLKTTDCPPPDKSLFMDPKMAKTWHGATSTNWSNVYGPKMRALMKELDNVSDNKSRCAGGDMDTESLESYETRCQTLPSKSLLDTMHKRFCADQYSEVRNVQLARSNTLFRLKNHTPVLAKRSQSFNIKMGSSSINRKGAAAGNPEPSPLVNRAAERVRIKTRPDVLYSPKLSMTREVTPDPLKTEDNKVS